MAQAVKGLLDQWLATNQSHWLQFDAQLQPLKQQQHAPENSTHLVKKLNFAIFVEGPFMKMMMQILTLGRDTWTFASPDPGALFKDF